MKKIVCVICCKVYNFTAKPGETMVCNCGQILDHNPSLSGQKAYHFPKLHVFSKATPDRSEYKWVDSETLEMCEDLAEILFSNKKKKK